MSSEIINTSVEEYKKLVESLHSENYEMMVDLTVVDWFRKKEPRFEVVVQFLSISKNQRKTINNSKHTMKMIEMQPAPAAGG